MSFLHFQRHPGGVIVDKYKLQSVDNALMILDIISEEGHELGISEISRRVSLGKSTVHRLLNTLAGRGYLVQNPDTGKYNLGIKIVNISAGILKNQNIIKECRPYLEELSEVTGETTHLCFYNNGEITFIHKVQGNNPSIMGSIVGASRPAYITATGKALLAYMPDKTLAEYLKNLNLKQYTPYTITDIDTLSKMIAAVKVNGYSEDQQESEEGLVCFAAPILNNMGEAIAALSISGAASRMNKRKDELIKLVKQYGCFCSKSFGWISNGMC
jgi:DNA-binding IclR family transcriptional regulator